MAAIGEGQWVLVGILSYGSDAQAGRHEERSQQEGCGGPEFLARLEVLTIGLLEPSSQPGLLLRSEGVCIHTPLPWTLVAHRRCSLGLVPPRAY